MSYNFSILILSHLNGSLMMITLTSDFDLVFDFCLLIDRDEF